MFEWLNFLIPLIQLTGIGIGIGLFLCAVFAPVQTIRAIYRTVRAIYREIRGKK